MHKGIYSDIEKFLYSTLRNKYITDDILTIYVRKSFRVIEGKLYPFIDLANIDVIENKRGQGIFTEFLINLIKNFPKFNIFIESVLNPKLPKKLESLGFKKKKNDEPTQIDYYLIQWI